MQQRKPPLGNPGLMARYRHEKEDSLPGSIVKGFVVSLGSIEEKEGVDFDTASPAQSKEYQWLCLHATKENDEKFSVWLLTSGYPSRTLDLARRMTARYIFQEGDSELLEFRDKFTGEAVLPVVGAWQYLIPHAAAGLPQGEIFPRQVRYLGHLYLLDGVEVASTVPSVPDANVLALRPDALIGPAYNTRQKDETRRYDGSDYELVRLTQADYHEMIEAGINCLRVDAEQVKFIERCPVFYWGIGGDAIRYPEHLYLSNYLGPGIFLDEPAVVTRDHLIRPRLKNDEEFRKSLTPQIALEAFKTYFHQARCEGAPTNLLKGLAARPDVDLGDMAFLQQNLFSWETMVSSAAYQLTADVDGPPSAMVFEPPGRFGTLRTLPEMNMAYGCQIPIDDPKNLAGIIYGFLRGAARCAHKGWGMSIYGQFDPSDAFWFQTHAYDLGARFFLYWDTHQLACVPYPEYLALSRNLSTHVERHPRRDLKGRGEGTSSLLTAAEVAILLEPGYNLGHVYMGRGNLWGLDELNLERKNRHGVKYRVVMHNFFVEIERCIRLGIAYDLLWALDNLPLSGYREVVHVREEGQVEVHSHGKRELLQGARIPTRPAGEPPQLTVELSLAGGKAPLEVTACATILERSAPVYYTLGADSTGVHRNEMALWELFGPEEEQYRFLNREAVSTHKSLNGHKSTTEIRFRIERPGEYGLRVATVDMAGRTAVVWKSITLE